MSSVREATNRVIEMMDAGMLHPETVVRACLSYMSEDDVREMAEMNEFFTIDEEDFCHEI